MSSIRQNAHFPSPDHHAYTNCIVSALTSTELLALALQDNDGFQMELRTSAGSNVTGKLHDLILTTLIPLACWSFPQIFKITALGRMYNMDES